MGSDEVSLDKWSHSCAAGGRRTGVEHTGGHEHADGERIHVTLNRNAYVKQNPTDVNRSAPAN